MNAFVTFTVPPSVTTLQPTPVVVDTTVDLVCVVTGDTPIDIVWEHVLTDGSVEEVFTGNDMTGGNFTLTVNMDDYGTYQCNASNIFGMNSASTEIIQAGKYLRRIVPYTSNNVLFYNLLQLVQFFLLPQKTLKQ